MALMCGTWTGTKFASMCLGKLKQNVGFALKKTSFATKLEAFN